MTIKLPLKYRGCIISFFKRYIPKLDEYYITVFVNDDVAGHAFTERDAIITAKEYIHLGECQRYKFAPKISN